MNDARRLVSASSKHVREGNRATGTHLEAFGMRKLMRQTGECGQPSIRVDPIPRLSHKNFTRLRNASNLLGQSAKSSSAS